MKKTLAALLCALLCLLPAANAEFTNPFSLFPTPTPEADGPSFGDDELPSFETPAPSIADASGSMRLSVLGKTIALDFDGDPQYSMVDGGYIQASFYAYDDADALYEVYLIFPESVASGSVVDAQSSIAGGTLDAGILLYVTDDTTELYAVASQDEYGVYPEESSYAISFDEVARSGSACTFSGNIEATLIALDDSYNPLYPIEDMTATFRFTLDLDGASTAPAPSAAPRLPGLIAPPDAKKI